jgi:hypothetical protein
MRESEYCRRNTFQRSFCVLECISGVTLKMKMHRMHLKVKEENASRSENILSC